MRNLKKEILCCRRCKLCEGRKNPVMGEGDLKSSLVLIGEAPGRKEDEMGTPFVGSAGKMLDGLLEDIGLERKEIYITNIVKCRPPGNRRPRKDEVNACVPHLKKQLEIISPRIIAPMGNSATGLIMKMYGLKREKIGLISGKSYPVEAAWGRALVFPLFHPAAVLYNRSLEKTLRASLKNLSKILDSENRSNNLGPAAF